MFMSNPFSELSAFIPPIAMQVYVILMFLLVIGSTLLDVIHKKSAKYFFENAQKEKKLATRTVGGGEMASIAFKTVAEDVLTSAEFCNPKRRISHLLTMYGFVIFLVTTVLMVFFYANPATPTPSILPQLWHLGALMVGIGGYWFWFFIRVDVVAEGYPWYRIVRADLFILSLLATATFGLIWSVLQAAGSSGWATLFFGLFIFASTVLFGGILWSKFAHMFFKPAAAFQKRMAEADGSRGNMPVPADKPEQFGLGIERQSPRNY
ncbi:MAG: adenylyl-sulfate reductase [Gammaproteobacteria bacterium]